MESLKDGHIVNWEEAAGLRMLRRLRVEIFFSTLVSSTVRWLFKEAREGLWSEGDRREPREGLWSEGDKREPKEGLELAFLVLSRPVAMRREARDGLWFARKW